MKASKTHVAGGIAALAVAAVGVVAGVTLTNSSSTISTATAVCTTPPCEGQTLSVVDNGTDPVRALGLVKSAVEVDLPSTTISGKQYFSNYTAYKGAKWFQGLSELTFAQALSTNKSAYDVAGNYLIGTTISGSRYFANPTKYVGGNWDLAMRVYKQVIAELPNQTATPPTIAIQP